MPCWKPIVIIDGDIILRTIFPRETTLNTDSSALSFSFFFCDRNNLKILKDIPIRSQEILLPSRQEIESINMPANELSIKWTRDWFTTKQAATLLIESTGTNTKPNAIISIPGERVRVNRPRMNAENRGIFQSCVTGLRRGRAGRIDLRRRGQDVEMEDLERAKRGGTRAKREREEPGREKGSRRIRSHVIGIVDSQPPYLTFVGSLRFPLASPPSTSGSILRLGVLPSPGGRIPASLSDTPWSRGYVVEPPRGYRIIIGCQVTRTLSAGFNWPIIVARIEVVPSVQIGVKLLGWPAYNERQHSATFLSDEYLLASLALLGASS